MEKKTLYIFLIPVIIFAGILIAGSPEEGIDESGNATITRMDPMRVEEIPTGTVLLGLDVFMFMSISTMTAYCSYFSEKVKFAAPESSVSKNKGSMIKPRNPPIPRSLDMHHKNGLFWTYSGFNRIMTRKGDSVFIAPDHCVKIIGQTVFFEGRKTKVTGRMLYEQLKTLCIPKDQVSPFYQEIIGGSKHVYTITPLSPEEAKAIRSIEGDFDFGSDRFDSSIDILKPRMKAMGRAIDDISVAARSTLENSKESLRVIKGNKMEIADGEREGRPITTPTDSNDGFM